MLPPELNIISLSIPSIVAQPGAVEVDGVADWTNNLGLPIGVVVMIGWIGESGGAITDTPWGVRNKTANKNWVGLGWDHYSPPTGINSNVWTFAIPQGALYVRPLEVVEFKVGLVNYNPTVAYGSAGATLYYLQ